MILIHKVTNATDRETNSGLQFLEVSRNGYEMTVVGSPGDYDNGDLVLVVPRLTTPSDALQRVLRVPPDTLNYHPVAMKLNSLFPTAPKGGADLSEGSDTEFSALLGQ